MANDEVLGPRKTMLVLVIVVGCFAVLWPRILSPLIVGHTQEQIKPNKFDREAAVKQERPVRAVGPHPALRERGRAIPPGIPPPGRQQMPPHVRVRSPLSVYFELEPPPIPGMRPPLGSPGGPVAAPKSSMGFVMPIYTICIIVFFVYTLSKILFKRTAVPYEPVTPDPQFRRRVFRDDSRTSPDKLVVTAISGLVAEVQQQMEASQQRQESQHSQTRPYTNGTILLNTGPVQIVTSEYQEPKGQTDSAQSKQNLAECKESSPESQPDHNTQEHTSNKNLTTIQEEIVQLKECVNENDQTETDTDHKTSIPSSEKIINEFETSTERKEFSPESNESADQKESSELNECIPIQQDLSLNQTETYSERESSPDQAELSNLNDPKEASPEPNDISGKSKESFEINTPKAQLKDSCVESQSPPELDTTDVIDDSKLEDSPIESLETSPDQAEPYPKSSEITEIESLPKQSSLDESSNAKSVPVYSEPTELDEKVQPEENEEFIKDSSLEKELKELYESSSEEDAMPELLNQEEREVSISPEPEACITPDHVSPINPIFTQSPKESDEELIILDKELTPEPNKSLSDSIPKAIEDKADENEMLVKDNEDLVLENFNVESNTVKSTEDFLKEEREVATKDGPSTPELLAEALKEDSPKNEMEDNESSAVKVLGMEVTAHPVDGSTWAGERPIALPKPPQEHKAEDVKSIFLETEIPQQSRVLVTDFEDRAHTQKPTKNAPLVVSGKMTLSLIQDAPRDTPERDPESTLDEFTTASAMTQPPAEKEELSDEEMEEELEEEEEIEEELSDEEVDEKTGKDKK